MITFPRFGPLMSKRDFFDALNTCFDAVKRMQTPLVAAPLQVTAGVLSLNGMSFKRYAARLTGVSEVSGQYQYTFIQQEYDATTGVYSDMTVGGLVGDGTSIYATEVNNTDVTETISPLTPTPAAGTGPFVWLRWKGQVGVASVFEFNLGLSSDDESLAVYNGDTEVDGAVARIDSDANNVLTWEEIAAGHVQFVVAAAALMNDGVVTTGTQTFAGGKTFNTLVTGIGGFTAPEFTSGSTSGITGQFASGGLSFTSNSAICSVTTGGGNNSLVLGSYTNTGGGPVSPSATITLSGANSAAPQIAFSASSGVPQIPQILISAPGGSVLGQTGTDWIGNEFTGGWCSSIGTNPPTVSALTNLLAMLPGYNGSVQQILGHDGLAGLEWYNVESGGSGVTGKTIGSEG